MYSDSLSKFHYESLTFLVMWSDSRPTRSVIHFASIIVSHRNNKRWQTFIIFIHSLSDAAYKLGKILLKLWAKRSIVHSVTMYEAQLTLDVTYNSNSFQLVIKPKSCDQHKHIAKFAENSGFLLFPLPL